MADNSNAPTVLITGGSSGIGRCTAMLFASRGWAVGLVARGLPGLETVRDEIAATGATVAIAVADVADAKALAGAADRIESELGPIEVWVNNAGISFYGAFPDITEAEFQRVTDVTYMGAVNGTRIALQRMTAKGEGSIVTVGAAIAYRGVPLQTAYSGAKFALRGFTEAVQSELRHAGSRIHVAMVHPPAVNTPFFSHAGSRMRGVPRPVAPVYPPGTIARAIYQAATTNQREITVGAPTIGLAWMNRLIPGAVDRMAGWFGFRSQQTEAPEVVERRDEAVFHPASRPSPVHGPFAAEAVAEGIDHPSRYRFWVVALLAGVGVLALANRRRDARPPCPRQQAEMEA